MQNAAKNSNVSQRSTHSRVQHSLFMLLYALFISFPVRHTDNFRFDEHHYIMVRVMLRKRCTVNLTDKVLSICKQKF